MMPIVVEPCRCPEFNAECMRPGHLVTRQEWEVCSGNCPALLAKNPKASEQVRGEWDRRTAAIAVGQDPFPGRVQEHRPPCVHLGEPTGEKVRCPTCNGNVQIKLMACSVFGQCSTAKKLEGIACCIGCDKYLASALPAS